MSEILLVIITTSLLSTTYLLFFGIRSYRIGSKYKCLVRDEIARSKFAEARNLLFEYGMKEKISFNDEFFKEMFEINSILMLQKEAYNEIGVRLFRLIFRAENQIDIENNNSRPELSNECINVLEKTIDGYGYLTLEYNLITRIIIKILFNDKITHKHAKLLIKMWPSKRVQTQLEVKSKAVRIKKKFTEFSHNYELACIG